MSGAKYLIEDHVGKTYNKWTVLSFSHSDKWAGFMWLCRCICGQERPVSAAKVVRGVTPSCITCSRSEEPNIWPFAISYIQKVRRGAVARDLVFEVSLQHLHDVLQAQEGLCALTGEPLVFAAKHPTPQTASLDRIDSSLGYIEGNVQWLHKDVNKMKNDLSQERFLEICKKATDMTEAAQVLACVAGGDC